MSFRTILEHQTIEGQFKFVNVGDCKSIDECVDYLNRWYPEYTIEEIEPIV